MLLDANSCTMEDAGTVLVLHPLLALCLHNYPEKKEEKMKKKLQ